MNSLKTLSSAPISVPSNEFVLVYPRCQQIHDNVMSSTIPRTGSTLAAVRCHDISVLSIVSIMGDYFRFTRSAPSVMASMASGWHHACTGQLANGQRNNPSGRRHSRQKDSARQHLKPLCVQLASRGSSFRPAIYAQSRPSESKSNPNSIVRSKSLFASEFLGRSAYA